MALTRPRKEREKLEANNRIHVKNQVSRSDIVPESDTITFPVNIRVDNHIRNQVTALINLGVESNMKRMVADMIEKEKESLTESQLNRFERMVKILEEKDYMAKSLKEDNNPKQQDLKSTTKFKFQQYFLSPIVAEFVFLAGKVSIVIILLPAEQFYSHYSSAFCRPHNLFE